MIRTTPSPANHFMNKFNDLGFIHANGEFDIRSSLLSVVLHDEIRAEGNELKAVNSQCICKQIDLGLWSILKFTTRQPGIGPTQ
jgi:hypothetical protein